MLPNMDATECPFAVAGLDPGMPCKDCHLCHSCLYFALENHENSAPVSPVKSDVTSFVESPVSRQPYEAAAPTYSYSFELEMMTSDEEADETFAARRRPIYINPEATTIWKQQQRSRSVISDNPDIAVHRSEVSLHRVAQTPSLSTGRPTHILSSNFEPSQVPDSQGNRRAETSFQHDPQFEGKFPEDHTGWNADPESSSAKPDSPPYVERSSCAACYEGEGTEVMIGCDGPNHREAWFHLSCVGLSVEPQPHEPWECPDCRRKRKVKRKPVKVSKQASAPEGRKSRKEPPQSTRKKVNQSWNPTQEALVGSFMQDILNERVPGIYNTEKRFNECAKRLKDHDVDRTEHSIKNWWNRNGRTHFNLDERNIKKPDKMRTSVTTPEKRKEARKRRHHDAVEDDSEAIPSSNKRLKRQIPEDNEADGEADSPSDKRLKRVVSDITREGTEYSSPKPSKFLKRGA
jgi:hypothetical protein